MDLLEFEELLNLIQNGDESERVEVKRSAEKIGDGALETISAFSNEPGLGGGYLVLGLTKNDSTKSPRYKVTGVSNPDKLQSELVTLCRQNFNKPIRHPEKRYSHCYEFGEALVLAIPRVIANIMRDIPQAFSMQPNSIFRKDIPLIPDVVIREAVCNNGSNH